MLIKIVRKYLDLKKIFAFFALLSILLNTISLPYYSVPKTYAQEEEQVIIEEQTEPTITPAPVEQIQPTPTETPVPTEEVSPPPSENVVPIDIQTPSEPSPTVLENVSASSIDLDSPVAEDSAVLIAVKSVTYPVVQGITYSLPDTLVSVLFTKVSVPGTVTISEVKLSAEQISQLNATSDTAYEITSTMADGTFEYELSLPIPSASENEEVEVKVAESVDEFDQAETVTEPKSIKNDIIKITDLTHFTVFVLVNDVNGDSASDATDDIANGALTAIDDTWVDQNSPTGNHGADSELKVRSKSGNDNKRTFVTFDASSVAGGSEVGKATLRLFLKDAPGASRTYQAYRVTGDWTEDSLDWDPQPGNAGATDDVASGTTNNVWLEWDVTGDVQAFVNGDLTNYGWMIRDSVEDSSTSREGTFRSSENGEELKRPQLVVDFATPDNQPSDYKSPTAQIANGGNGFENNPTGAFDDGGLVASHTNNTAGESHIFYNYNPFDIPEGSTINGIEVRTDWRLDDDGGTNNLSVELSWDGGESWTTAKSDVTETDKEHVASLGGSSDTWGRTWNASEFSNDNFRVRAIMNSSASGRDFYLDWIPVRVYYTEPTTARIRAFKYFDVDQNGIYDGDDYALEGWRISLYDDRGFTYIADRVTGADGYTEYWEDVPVEDPNELVLQEQPSEDGWTAINPVDRGGGGYGTYWDGEVIVEAGGSYDFFFGNWHLSDTTPPTIESSQTQDADGNGYLDGIKLIFSENIDDSRLSIGSADGWDINGYDGETIGTEESENDNILLLSFSEGESFDTGATPTVTYTPSVNLNSTHDTAGNELESLETTPDDKASPVLVSAVTQDSEPNGNIDRVLATFSEDLNDDSVTNDKFDVSSYSIVNVLLSGGIVEIILDENSFNDTGSRPDVSVFEGDEESVEDLNGNAALETNITASDGAAPVSTIDLPLADSIHNSTIEISGTSTDGTGDTVSYVRLFFKNSNSEIEWTEIPESERTNEESSEPYEWSYSWTPEEDGTFDIKVEATDDAQNSEQSPTVSGIVYDITSPETPSEDPAAGDYDSDQEVTLSSNDSLSGVNNIFYTTDGTDPSDINGTVYGDPITIGVDTTLKAIAYDNAGNPSDILTAEYGIAPVISDETSGFVTGSSATITWTTDDPATSRVVYDTVSHPDLGEAPDYGYVNSTVETDTDPKVTDHSVAISGLTSGTSYFYRTISHGSPEAVSQEHGYTTSAQSVGGTSTSTSSTGTSSSAPSCNDQKPGSAPILLSAVSGLNNVTLSWSEALNPVTYYLITYGTSPGLQMFGNPNIGGKGTTSFTVNSLSGGTTYYFKVRAGNGCAPGEFSNELSETAGGRIVEGPAAGFTPGFLGEEDAPTPVGVAKTDERADIANFNPKVLWIILALSILFTLFVFKKFKKLKKLAKKFMKVKRLPM